MRAVQSGIALSPQARRGPRPRYPFLQLQAGHSFAVPVPDGETADATITKLRSASCSWQYRNKPDFGFKLRARYEDAAGRETTAARGKLMVRVYAVAK